MKYLVEPDIRERVAYCFGCTCDSDGNGKALPDKIRAESRGAVRADRAHARNERIRRKARLPVRIRGDGVCFRGRQAVRVVIQHGGIVAADRGILLRSRVQDGQAGCGQRQAENGDEQHTDRRPVPVKRSVHTDHLLSHDKENIIHYSTL